MRLPSRPTTSVLLVLIVVLAGCAGGLPAEGPSSITTDSPRIGSTTSTQSGTLEVHFINVGQSVSTPVVGPTGETMLIDTGHYQDDGEHVLAYLKEHDINRIDHLVVSHADADHIGGNAAVIEYYETQGDGIGVIYDPGIAASTQTYEEYLDAVERHNVTLYQTRAGDPINFEGVDVSVLGPPDPYLENRDRNENSIVLKLTYGRTSFLLTGDAEDDEEAYLVSTYGERLNATVLKAGHHGSSSSTSAELLDVVRPKAVVISSAYDSQYGHPTEEILGRLAARSIPAYWTATHGDIVLVSDGWVVSVRTQEAAPTDPDSLRAGSPIEPGTGGEVVERARIEDTLEPQEPTTVTDGGTSSVEFVVEEVQADASGDERENLNDEYVVFRNSGEESLDLSGWTVADEAGHTYTFPAGTTLAAGSSLTLHTGTGRNTETDVYWNSRSPIWNNGGDTVIVRNSQGSIVREETYS